MFVDNEHVHYSYNTIRITRMSAIEIFYHVIFSNTQYKEVILGERKAKLIVYL